MKNEAEEKAEEYGQLVSEGTGIIDFKHVSTNAYMDGYNEAMRWRDPKEELPEEGVDVFVKILSSCEAGDEILHTSSSVRNDFYHSKESDPFACEGYYPSGNGGRVRATVIGWRPIENKNHFEGRIEKAGCDFCRDEQGYTIGNMYVCDKCGRQVP